MTEQRDVTARWFRRFWLEAKLFWCAALGREWEDERVQKIAKEIVYGK